MKVKGQGHREVTKMLKSFLRISSSKVDRFTSNKDQNDYRSIIHIIEYISPAEMFRFCVIRERRMLQRPLVYQSGLTTASQTSCKIYNDDDDDNDESKSYVRPLLQLETVTSVLVIRSDKQFSFQITTERGCKMAAA